MLCIRVLLDAQFYGMDWLLCDVKAAAQRNLQPDVGADAAAAFDAAHGSLEDAIRSGVLPARFFSCAPPDKVKQILPARDTDRIVFPGTTVSRPALGFALVEQSDGTTRVDGLIAADLHLDAPEADDAKQITLASTFRRESQASAAVRDEFRLADLGDGDDDPAFKRWAVQSGSIGATEFKCRELMCNDGSLNFEDNELNAGELAEWANDGFHPQLACPVGTRENTKLIVLLKRVGGGING